MTQAKSSHRPRATGLGQLTLIEHALCPLDPPSGPFQHETAFCHFENKRRQKAKVTIHCPLGLRPTDEFYLWGLLALTRGQRDRSQELVASPYYCLKELGIGWGGKQVRLFDEACSRLAAIHYRCTNFWDPVRQERVKAEFGLFERIRPLKNESRRAWRFLWSPVFYELSMAAGGFLHFDLATYRSLDAASRRLFLLARKQLHRSEATQWFDLRDLCIHQLGFSAGLESRYLKRKLKAVADKLAQIGFLAPIDLSVDLVRRRDRTMQIRFRRGPGFSLTTESADPKLPTQRQAEYSQLLRIGLEKSSATWVLRTFPARLVREWCEITIAAMERGRQFTSSPAAYFMHYVKLAAHGTATAPDWWHAARKQDQLYEAARHRAERTEDPDVDEAEENRAFAEFLRTEGRNDMEAIARALAGSATSPVTVQRRVAAEARTQLLPRFREMRRSRRA